MSGSVWYVPEEIPECKEGDFIYITLAVKRGHNDQVYVYPAAYLNRYPVREWDSDDLLNDREFTGFYEVHNVSDLEERVENVCTSPGDKILGWAYLPKWEEVASGK